MSTFRNASNPQPEPASPVNPDCAVVAKFGFLTPTLRDNSTCCQSPEVTCSNERVVSIKSTGRFLRNSTDIRAFSPSGYSIPRDIDGLVELTSINITFPNNASLSLSNGLTDGLFRLPNLQVLIIRNAGVFGSIPAAVGNLTKLTVLDVADNGIGGSVPSSIGKLKNLEVLDLSYNALSGPVPDAISSLPLKTLRLGRNNFDGVLPPLPSTITDCQITSGHLFEANAFDCYNGTFKASPSACRVSSTGSALSSRRFNECPWIVEASPQSPYTRSGFIATIAVAILVPILALLCVRNAKRVKQHTQQEPLVQKEAEDEVVADETVVNQLSETTAGAMGGTDANASATSGNANDVKDSQDKRLRKCCCFPLGPGVKLLLVLQLAGGIAAGLLTLSAASPLTNLNKDELMRANITESYRDYLVLMVQVCAYLAFWGAVVSLLGLICAIRKSIQGFKVFTATYFGYVCAFPLCLVISGLFSVRMISAAVVQLYWVLVFTSYATKLQEEANAAAQLAAPEDQV